MLRQELTTLLPDEPFDQFRDVGSFHWPLRQLWYAQTVRGYQGVGRKVWTNRGSQADGWLVLDVIAERVHSSSDAEQLSDLARPPISVISALSGYELTIKDTADGIRMATWLSNGLSFLWLARTVNSFLVQTTVVGDDFSSQERVARESLQHVEGSLGTQSVDASPGLGRWARVVWELVNAIPAMFIFLFIPYAVGYFIGPQPVPLITMLIGLVIWLRLGPGWQTRARTKRLLTVWSNGCRQGDLDGTIGRALASLGHPFPVGETGQTLSKH